MLTRIMQQEPFAGYFYITESIAMKTILVATDFSNTARNAVNYAAALAKRTKARLVMLHAWQPQIFIAEAPLVLSLSPGTQKDCLKRLSTKKAALAAKHGPSLKIETVCLEGTAADTIKRYALEIKADLIVVGTHGAGFLEEKLLGSIASELIKNAKSPVISVPAKVKFKNIKRIVLATDYGQTETVDILQPLKKLAGVFGSHIYVLNVMPEKNAIPTVSQAIQGMRLEHLLDRHDHSFHSATSNDVVSGINDFVKLHGADLTVMLPRHLSFMKTLTKKSNSKAMAFHTKTPLLTIHT
jgi:nucleotide-binding universal stress UspA family protein